MKVFAPGKLILSGEHAVVYGHPALAMAINRYVMATATTQTAPGISLNLADLAYQSGFSVSSLAALKDKIKAKYRRFLQGDFRIRDVLQKPVELAQVALSLFLEVLNIQLTQGVNIHVASTIPIGCGMGSSAATVLSIVHAIANHLEMDVTPEMFLRLGLEAENMQHGYSSGLDLKVSLYGGCLYTKAGELTQHAVPTLPLFLVNTGTPANTTGECVEAVASYFKTTTIGDDFAAVTDAFASALQTNQLPQAQAAIRENHRLLTRIGVVPASIQTFATAVEAIGGATKICGAGAISGTHAGVALVMTEDADALAKIRGEYRYDVLPIQGEARGVHVI